mgnify:CR=1 FL=1
MSKNLPRIENVKALKPFVLRVKFAGGKEFEVDLAGFLREYEFFAPLLDSPDLFSKASVGEWGWDVVWPEVGVDGDEIDISASTLWRLALEQAGEAMPRDEFRAWRARHGLSLTGAAETLGVSRRMIAYYDSGERLIPKTVMLACKGVEAAQQRQA